MKKKRIIKNIVISVIIILLGLSVFFTMKLAKTELINNNINEKMEMPEPPDMNQNSNSSNKENGDFKPDNMKPNEINSNEIKLSTKFYILFILESIIISVLILYMIISKFNKDMFKQVFCNIKKVIIFVIFVIILSVGISISTIEITKNVFFLVDEINSPGLNMPGGNMMNPNQNNNSVEATATTIVNGNEQSLTEKYIPTNSDESALLVENGGNATISNAVFSTGTDSKIYISDSTITTEGESSSRGLDATYGGYIEADNISTLKMNLSDNSSYEGTINSENTAKNIALKIDSSSKIKLTGDSYVTSLEDEDANYNNIDFNGFKLYVNGVAIN